MSSTTFSPNESTAINMENTVGNIGNNLFSALKMSITAQSIDKSDGDNVEHSKVLLVKTFNAKIKCHSPLQDMVFSPIREFRCFYCTRQENDTLPMSMTCNIDMLNDIFGSKNDDGDWFLDDYKNVMINKIKDTFDKFGVPDTGHCLPSLSVKDFIFREILNF